MPDITLEFQKYVEKAQNDLKTNSDADNLSGGLNEKKGPAKESIEKSALGRPKTDKYLTDAYIIAQQLDILGRTLQIVKPAYLNTGTLSQRGMRSRYISEKRYSTEKDEKTSRLEDITSRWANMGKRRLNPSECEDIDSEVKNSVRKLLSMIKGQEKIAEELLKIDQEKEAGDVKHLLRRLVNVFDPRNAGRALNEGSGANSSSSSGSSGKVAPEILSHTEIKAAHRSAVTWWLNHRLMQISKAHASMQRTRLNQKLEREMKQVAAGSNKTQSKHQPPHNSAATTHLEDYNKNGMPGDDNDNDNDLSVQLSEQERQQLQIENEDVLKELDSTLDQVRNIQRSLLEISSIQSQLAQHLSHQAAQTERLYNEAVGAVESVEVGNMSLVSAHRHQSDTRKWVLFIVIVSSFVLLFLDWYS
ncbi:hypothetical protein H4219_001053 [Mycoemilia scoparia]|uniref:t-SNARE coiled-coil homology domain-containing protein n=1 Tax=Mycoemilia scoparia TaxID=417184 RepID=A0A9W8A1F2_9FUNG|nr:hypothetical protein H4219_001053 [Mycoemilia scoparia]